MSEEIEKLSFVSMCMFDGRENDKANEQEGSQ